jgi:hypothetical protein
MAEQADQADQANQADPDVWDPDVWDPTMLFDYKPHKAHQDLNKGEIKEIADLLKFALKEIAQTEEKLRVVLLIDGLAMVPTSYDEETIKALPIEGKAGTVSVREMFEKNKEFLEFVTTTTNSNPLNQAKTLVFNFAFHSTVDIRTHYSDILTDENLTARELLWYRDDKDSNSLQKIVIGETLLVPDNFKVNFLLFFVLFTRYHNKLKQFIHEISESVDN